MTSIYILSVIVVVSTTFFNPSDYKPKEGFHEDSLRNELGYMKDYNGLYPNKVKLLGNNPLTKRLKSLLKSRYNFLIKTWGPETPIKVEKNTFIA